jgi:spore coat protein CotH
VWEKETNANADDWTDLIALCQLIDQTPASNLKQALDPVIDVESVLTALALDNLTANLDSYAGAGENFYGSPQELVKTTQIIDDSVRWRFWLNSGVDA